MDHSFPILFAVVLCHFINLFIIVSWNMRERRERQRRKKRRERQRRKRKIYPFEGRVPKNSKERQESLFQ